MSLKVPLPADVARCQNTSCSIKENCYRHTTKQVDNAENNRFMVHHEFKPKEVAAGAQLELNREACTGFIATPNHE